MPEWTIKEPTVENGTKCDPSAYMTKEECDHEHEKIKEYYEEVIKNARERRVMLEVNVDNIWKEISDYKKAINGKFDWIMKTTILMFAGIAGSLIVTLWTSHTTNTAGAERFNRFNELRTEQQIVMENFVRNSQKVLEESRRCGK